jgi:hypothetical protein
MQVKYAVRVVSNNVWKRILKSGFETMEEAEQYSLHWQLQNRHRFRGYHPCYCGVYPYSIRNGTKLQ